MYEGIVNFIDGSPDDIQAWEDLYRTIQGDVGLLLEWRDRFKAKMGEFAEKRKYEEAERMREVLFHTLCATSRVRFEDYLECVEFNRGIEQKFYAPRKHYLKPIVEGYQAVADGKLDFLSISMPKRAGKALTMDTKLLTPNGWITMREAKVGTVLIGADGKETKITDVFPQGETQTYNVYFSNGEKVQTCGNHLWAVQTQEDRGKKKNRYHGVRVMSTLDLMNSRIKICGDNHNNYSIDYMKPAQFSKKELPLHPYLVGVLLGDGSIHGDARFTSWDKEVVERVKEVLPVGDRISGYNRKNTYLIVGDGIWEKDHYHVSTTMKELRKMGLEFSVAYNKFIPNEYLWSCEEDRWELLRGLLDTDGCASERHIEYSTTSEVLAKQFQFLVRSLGGRCNIKSRMGRYKKDGKYITTRKNYRCHCVFPKGTKPFYLSRKNDVYKPKREVLRHFIERIEKADIQETQCICVDNDSKLFIAGDDMIPTHNSQLGINFTCYMSGKNPERSTLMEGTGDDLVRSFYTGCLEYLNEPSDYNYHDIFPMAKLVQTNADTKIINLQDKKRFPTIMCRSIDARQVGLSEASNLLYLDDCVEGREEAKNRRRLDEKWEVISGDIIGRALEGTPIIICGTRYSLYDPIGRLQEHATKQGWRWKAIEIPALDKETDESNYAYYNPKTESMTFTTEYFREQRELISAEQFESEFQQTPFEAKGLLFPEPSLNRFYELPKDIDPDAIVAVCDPAGSGIDSTACPIAYVYGEDVYIVDVVFDDAPPEITKPEIAKKLIEHNASSCLFEVNTGGDYYARDVDTIIRNNGGRVGIRTKRTLSNKHTRIEFASDNIIRNFYFLDSSRYDRSSQYARFMKELTTYTRSGKNAHDDAPDSLSLLENELKKVIAAPIEVFARPF